MKKLFVGLMVCSLVLTSGVTVFAMGHHGGGTGQGRYYVDTNGDGICDHYGTGVYGQGRYYVDANGDGICDHYGTGWATGCHGYGCYRG